jgi:hypothetical protein
MNNLYLERFNFYVNLEAMSRPHGSFITHEDLEATTLRAMIYAIAEVDPTDGIKESRCIDVDDILILIKELEVQSDDVKKIH